MSSDTKTLWITDAQLFICVYLSDLTYNLNVKKQKDLLIKHLCKTNEEKDEAWLTSCGKKNKACSSKMYILFPFILFWLYLILSVLLILINQFHNHKLPVFFMVHLIPPQTLLQGLRGCDMQKINEKLLQCKKEISVAWPGNVVCDIIW